MRRLQARWRYALVGAAFGGGFPLLAWVVDAFAHDLPLSWATIIALHGVNVLHYVIDTAPLFLGALAALAGSKQDSLRTSNTQLTEHAASLQAEVHRHEETMRDLVRARDEAETAARAKAAFLASMSHEIRTPMNGVIGMAGLLLDGPLEDDARECAEAIRRSGESLLTILNDILDFSKIEAGRLELESTELDVCEIVEDICDLLASRAQSKGVQLAYLLGPGLEHPFIGDPGRIRQVLTNIVGNAIKFTSEGEVVVEIEACEGGACFRVRDTGPGISEEVRGLIFEPFTQADQTTTRKYGGTGLGLSISRRLVDQMGGRIEVDSAPGHGAVFAVQLPLQRGRGLSRDLLPRDFDGRRVLVVDDHEINRRMLHSLMGGWNLQVVEASSVAEALACLDQGEHFDLVVTDYAMPDEDGLQLCRELDVRGLVDLPRVMVTSWSDRVHATHEAQRCFSAVLNKPVRKMLLLRAIAGALGYHSATEGPTRPDVAAFEAVRGRVLLVEDNQVNQAVARRQLERLGLEVDLAQNGEEAISAVRRRDYTLVLMDCQMPVMDGYEATERIRALGRYADLPIVAMTASALPEDRARCLAAGMTDHIAKPVRLEDLRDWIQANLPTHEAQGTSQ
ncbi:MAG: response regulator [Myxococcales bacterium]|nr:response regulator [Myxococcales bacterium]